MPGKIKKLKNYFIILPLQGYFNPLIEGYKKLKEKGLSEEKYAKELKKEIFRLTEKAEFYILAICFILALNIFSAMFVEFAAYPDKFQFLGFKALLGNVLVIWLLGVSFIRDFKNLFIGNEDELFLFENINSKNLKIFFKFTDKFLSEFYKYLWIVFGTFAVIFFCVNAQVKREDYCDLRKYVFYFIVMLIVFFIYYDGKHMLYQIRNAIGAFIDVKITQKEASGNLDAIL